MKKYLLILFLAIASIAAKAQIRELAELTTAPGGKYAIVIDSLIRGGVHAGVSDTITRNQIDILKRRVGMWVVTLNNAGSDGIETVWQLKSSPLANNGSNWLKIFQVVSGVITFNGFNSTGSNQTVVTKNTASAGSALNVVTYASSVSDILNLAINNGIGDQTNWHIYQAPPSTGSGTTDVNLLWPDRSGAIFTDQDLNRGLFPAHLTALTLDALGTGISTDSVLVKHNGVIKSVTQSSISGGGGGSGTVTSVATGTGLTGGTITTTGTISADTTILQTVPNFFPKGDTRYLRSINGLLAGGALSGTYPNPSLASSSVTGIKIASGAVDLTTKVSGILPVANGGTGTSHAPVFSEVPSGSINSSNTSFTIANTPTTGTFQIWRNGLLQIASVDYTRSGTVLTWLYAPTTGDTLLANYQY